VKRDDRSKLKSEACLPLGNLIHELRKSPRSGDVADLGSRCEAGKDNR
jgi:hypothetical protein